MICTLSLQKKISVCSFILIRRAYFFKLPNLKSICHEALAFPCLERIYVLGCPSLRKLPLSLESGKRNGVLIGEEEWWNQLEWDDEATKHVFSSKLIITTPQTGISIPQPSYTYEATIRPRYELICIEVENLMYYACIFLMRIYF